VIKIAIVGFGTVGESVARILTNDPREQLSLSMIFNRNVQRKKVDWISSDVVWTEDFEVVLESDVDVIVELVGGMHPAADWLEAGLAAGKAVVTANKQVIAEHGSELITRSVDVGRPLLFEAAVAGGIPIVRGLNAGLAGDSIIHILGLLNGTCNYILTRMAVAKIAFETALKEAQQKGFAEADPTADVDGGDAGAKLSILTAIGLGCPVSVGDIPMDSIRPVEYVDFSYADRLGSTIRQVARAKVVEDKKDAVCASVGPMLVPQDSELARTQGSENIVVVTGNRGGRTAFSGHGAGGDPTAVAVVSDLMEIAMVGQVRTAWPTERAQGNVQVDYDAKHYLRFVVVDAPGILAKIAAVLSRYEINVDSILQEPGWSKSELPFVVTLEHCNTSSVRAALSEINGLGFHAKKPLWLPILDRGES
jgi:homoserine dehydrogenase